MIYYLRREREREKIESIAWIHTRQLSPRREPQLSDHKIWCMDGRYIWSYTSIPWWTAWLMSTLLSLSENKELLEKHDLPSHINQYIQEYFQYTTKKYTIVGHGDDIKQDDSYFDRQDDEWVRLIECACGCGFIKNVSSAMSDSNTILLNNAILHSVKNSPNNREQLKWKHQESYVIIVDGLYELEKNNDQLSFVIHLPSIDKLIQEHSQWLYEYIVWKEPNITIRKENIQHARKEQYLSEIALVWAKLNLWKKERYYISPQWEYFNMIPL